MRNLKGFHLNSNLVYRKKCLCGSKITKLVFKSMLLRWSQVSILKATSALSRTSKFRIKHTYSLLKFKPLNTSTGVRNYKAYQPSSHLRFVFVLHSIILLFILISENVKISLRIVLKHSYHP